MARVLKRITVRRAVRTIVEVFGEGCDVLVRGNWVRLK